MREPDGSCVDAIATPWRGPKRAEPIILREWTETGQMQADGHLAGAKRTPKGKGEGREAAAQRRTTYSRGTISEPSADL